MSTVAEIERAIGHLPSDKEEYVLELIASDGAVDELERTLEGRLAGAFEPLEGDWKERVRQSAAKLGWGSNGNSDLARAKRRGIFAA